MLGQSRLHAADIIENKSSTFNTQLNSRNSSTNNDSAIAEKIRAQRAAIDARDSRNTATAQVKASASQNNCDNDLRKCINNACGANYKKCETDSDTTFSDKLNTCRKNTTCTAHEFTLFTNEIKEDKKQAISLALYNNVLDCGNSYNDCIIQQCGPKFNKCLSKSAGDKAINACKTIAQNCTEADSGLSGRVGNVFGIVRVDAEKQIKTDEAKLQSLRDQMRNSCRTLGALFDDRSLDCVFTANFFAGDDKTHPMASKKLYAGSLFDCTPDWFGIDITTFKENAYRATRAQTAASSAMLGSGVGTAVGALTSGAISRAIETKKAKDALEDACKENGQVLKDGKCVDKEPDDTDEDSADEDEEDENEEESLTPEQKCTQSGGAYDNNNCTCPDDKKVNGDMCVDMKKKDKCEKAGGKLNVLGQCKCTDETKKYENEQCIDDPDAIAKKDCKDSGGKWKKNQCQCDDETQNLTNGKCVDDPEKIEQKRRKDETNAGLDKAVADAAAKEKADCENSGGKLNRKGICECSSKKGLILDKYTCKCQDANSEWKNGACMKKTTQTPTNATDIMALCTTKYKGNYDPVKKECKCPATDDGKCEQWWNSAKPKLPTSTDIKNAQAMTKCKNSGGQYINGQCSCPANKNRVNGECVAKKGNNSNTNSNDDNWEEISKYASPASNIASKICLDNGKNVVTGTEADCNLSTKKCAFPCHDKTNSDQANYFVVCCDMSGTTPSCKKTSTTGTNSYKFLKPSNLSANICK